MVQRRKHSCHRFPARNVGILAALLAFPLFAQAPNPPKIEVNMAPTPNVSKLAPCAYQPLPLGEIRPQGWLLNQLRIQANGLSGHLDEFWPDIKDSGWIGGKAEGWERGPYWLDGVVPLAFLLDDPKLKEKVTRWMDYILTHQQDDGWLGPKQSGGYHAEDPWPTFVIFKALTQYLEATHDERVIPAMKKACTRLSAVLDATPLFDWNKHRWMDFVLSLHYLYERTGDEKLLDLAAKAKAQGFDWRAHFADFKYTDKVLLANISMATHVVNNAMSVKAGAVWYRQSKDAADRDSVYRTMEMLDQYHGQVTGVFTGDEHYAGKCPSQGTELCSVVEYMFSLETLLSILGDPAFGDRLERIAFNALPATFKPDMWTHQYDQQVNQVVCRVSEDRVYATNSPNSNIFGLEPNYGCCTANMHQGWPKFASHLWMKTADGGLAAMAYAPCTVNTTLDGKPVRIDVETDYPFNDTITMSIEAGPKFPVRLRIPAWADVPTVAVGNEAPQACQPGTFHTIDRVWAGKTTLTLKLPMKARVERRFNDSVAILRGPLVYSLKVGAYWKKIGGEEPHADWEVYPTAPWNYGLIIDVNDPDKSVIFETRPIGECPFSPDGAPIRVTVKGKLVPEWIIEHSAAGPAPKSPIQSTQPVAYLTLIPYGCTKLRVTEFPLIESAGPKDPKSP